MLMIFAVLVCYLIKQERKGLKNSGVNGTRNPDLCDARAVLYQLSYKANYELVIMSVNDKLLDGGCTHT